MLSRFATGAISKGTFQYWTPCIINTRYMFRIQNFKLLTHIIIESKLISMDLFTGCGKIVMSFIKVCRGEIALLEWIPKWQNKTDAWFSDRIFSKMARKSWIFHINHNRKLCMGQKWQKLQIQELLNEVYPKGIIFEMTLFSLIDLDKIMPKNPK